MVSIIIPTWNEAEALPITLKALHADPGDKEILVVDAGSTDNTIDVARAAGCTVLHSDQRQRAHQMNLGAAQARGDVLWFVHADTHVPPGSLGRLLAALQDESVVGGGFARRFRSRSPLLFITCLLAQVRGHWSGLFFGDQAMYVRADTFRAVGGFADRAVFEDFDLCRQLRVHGRMQQLTPAVRTSARRFQHGALTMVVRDAWWTLRYFLRER